MSDLHNNHTTYDNNDSRSYDSTYDNPAYDNDRTINNDIQTHNNNSPNYDNNDGRNRNDNNPTYDNNSRPTNDNVVSFYDNSRST